MRCLSRPWLYFLAVACVFNLVVAGIIFLRFAEYPLPLFRIHLSPSDQALKDHNTTDSSRLPTNASSLPTQVSNPSIAFADPPKALSSYIFTDNGITPSECLRRFKGLFDEIDRSVELRKGASAITPTEIDVAWKDDGVARVMIFHNKLYIIEARVDKNSHGYPRFLAILHQIQRAVESSPIPLPCIEFTITVTDIPDKMHRNHTIWAFSRLRNRDDNTWLMPDFGYWSWPLKLVGDYERVRLEMQEFEVDWEKKIPKALWRGAVKTNPEVRNALIEATREKPWADVEEVTWKSKSEVNTNSNALPIAEHCKYQFLIQTEGRSYSGRGKYLLNCASVVIIHKSDWIEPHSHLYVRSGPLQNVVEVARDFSDLETKVQELLQNPERAKAIARNSVVMFRDKNLMPSAEICYWRQLFLSWAQVSFTPEPWEIDETGHRRIRGVAFETFVSQGDEECSWWKAILHQC